MASKTALINKALTLCGSRPIVSIDDATENARAVNRVYDISLKSVLSECLWKFATKRRLLAQSADELEWYFSGEGEQYIYARPVDVVRIFGTNDEDATWREEGDYILSDTSALGIRYVYYLDNPVKYSASFTEAFIDKLCSDISFMILNSASKAEAFLKKYHQVSLPKAMAENAQIGQNQVLKDDAWVLSKNDNGALNA